MKSKEVKKAKDGRGKTSPSVGALEKVDDWDEKGEVVDAPETSEGITNDGLADYFMAEFLRGDGEGDGDDEPSLGRGVTLDKEQSPRGEDYSVGRWVAFPNAKMTGKVRQIVDHAPSDCGFMAYWLTSPELEPSHRFKTVGMKLNGHKSFGTKEEAEKYLQEAEGEIRKQILQVVTKDSLTDNKIFDPERFDQNDFEWGAIYWINKVREDVSGMESGYVIPDEQFIEMLRPLRKAARVYAEAHGKGKKWVKDTVLSVPKAFANAFDVLSDGEGVSKEHFLKVLTVEGVCALAAGDIDSVHELENYYYRKGIYSPKGGYKVGDFVVVLDEQNESKAVRRVIAIYSGEDENADDPTLVFWNKKKSGVMERKASLCSKPFPNSGEAHAWLSEQNGEGNEDTKERTASDRLDAILESVVLDADPEKSDPEFWAKHDKARHHGHFDPDTMTCKLREEYAKGAKLKDLKDELDDIGDGKPDAGATEKKSPQPPKLSKKQQEFVRLMQKKHPDMPIGEIMRNLGEVGKIKDAKLAGDACRWLLKGAVRLPEDMYKVEQARELSGKANKDPFAYNTPQACINALTEGGFKLKAKPITVEELKNNPLMSDYRDEGYGVETFQVDDSQKGQALMRRIIDTHWGEDANPWCLLARKDSEDEQDEDANERFGEWWGSLTAEEKNRYGETDIFSEDLYDDDLNEDAVLAARDRAEGYFFDNIDKAYDSEDASLRTAWHYWHDVYNGLPKRVAFKDGKLLAFMATDKMDEDQAFDDTAYGGGRLAKMLPDLYDEYEKWQYTEEGQEEEGANFYQWLNVEHYDELQDALDNPPEEWWDREDNSSDVIPVGMVEAEGDRLHRKADGELIDNTEATGKDSADDVGSVVRVQDMVADAIMAAVGQDALDPNDPDFWAKHDRAKHHGHFDPETMTCKLREKYAAGEKLANLRDEMDDIDPGDVPEGADNPDRQKVIQEMMKVALLTPQDKRFIAPNGEDTNLSEIQWLLVRTPTFKKWFGDWEYDPEHASKALDKNGEPLVLYHGTELSADFTDEDNTEFKERLFTTTSRSTARSYTPMNGDATVAPWKVYKNPYDEKTSKELIQEAIKDAILEPRLEIKFTLGDENLYTVESEGDSESRKDSIAFANKVLEGLGAPISDELWENDYNIAEAIYEIQEKIKERGKGADKIQEIKLKREYWDDSGVGAEYNWTTGQVEVPEPIRYSTLKALYKGELERIRRYYDEMWRSYSKGKPPKEKSGAIYEFFVNIRNPMVVDAEERLYGDLEFEGKTISDPVYIADIAQGRGYDGLILKNVSDTADAHPFEDIADDYVTFDAAKNARFANFGMGFLGQLTKNEADDISDKLTQILDKSEEYFKLMEQKCPDVDPKELLSRISTMTDIESIKSEFKNKVQGGNVVGEDSMPDQDAAGFWAKHDKARHHGHFDPETMTCKLREKFEQGEKLENLRDEMDDIDVDSLHGNHEEVPARKENTEPQIMSQEEMDSLANLFGTTSNLEDAGWILPDGRLIDLKKAHRADEKKEHSELGKALYALRGGKDGDSSIDRVNYARESGAIRLTNFEGNVFLDIGRKPTKEQIDVLYDVADHKWGGGRHGLMHGIDLPGRNFLGYENDTELSRRMVNEIKSFFDNREGPESGEDGKNRRGEVNNGERGDLISDPDYGIISDVLKAEKERKNGRPSQLHQRVPEEALRGEDEDTRILREASLICRAVEGAGSAGEGDSGSGDRGRERNPKSTVSGVEQARETSRRQEAILEKYARKMGIWEDDAATALKESDDYDYIEGGESIAFFPDDPSKPITKVITSAYFPETAQLLDRIILHNYLFPSSKLEVKGFGRARPDWLQDGDPMFCVKVEQQQVDTSCPAKPEQIAEHMKNLGFHKHKELASGDIVWESNDGRYVVSDLTDENAFIDQDGTIEIIDANIQLNTPGSDGSGKYRLPPYKGSAMDSMNGIAADEICKAFGSDKRRDMGCGVRRAFP